MVAIFFSTNPSFRSYFPSSFSLSSLFSVHAPWGNFRFSVTVQRSVFYSSCDSYCATTELNMLALWTGYSSYDQLPQISKHVYNICTSIQQLGLHIIEPNNDMILHTTQACGLERSYVVNSPGQARPHAWESIELKKLLYAMLIHACL